MENPSNPVLRVTTHKFEFACENVENTLKLLHNLKVEIKNPYEKLDVETWKSTWNNKFLLHSWKIELGNVKLLSNLLIINVLSFIMFVEMWKFTWLHEILTMFIEFYMWNRGYKLLISGIDWPSIWICPWDRDKIPTQTDNMLLLKKQQSMWKIGGGNIKITWNPRLWVNEWKIGHGNVKCSSNQFKIDGQSFKCLWKRGNPHIPMKFWPFS